MLQKLNAFYLFIIILNLWFKLYTAADNSQNGNRNLRTRMVNTNWSSVTADEDTWQPIIKQYKWLTVSTTLAPQQSVSITPSKSATISLWQSENFTNNSTNNVKQKYRGYIKPQTYYNYAYSHQQQQQQQHGNYSKRHIKPLTSTTSASIKSSLLSELPTVSSATQSIKNLKLKSYAFPTNNKSSNKNNKNHTRGREKIQLSSHHNRQQIYPLNNAKETLYPQIQIPKDIISHVQEQQQQQQQQRQQQQSLSSTHHVTYEKNSISSQLNLKTHITDIGEHKQLTTPSSFLSSSSYWHHFQKPQLEAKSIISLTPKIDISNMNTTKHINLNVKTNTNGNENEKEKSVKSNNAKHFNDTITTKTLNSFTVNENLIDNEIIKNEKHHHHHYKKNLENRGFKVDDIATNIDVKNSTKSIKSVSDNVPVVAATNDDGDGNGNEDNLNVELLLLKQTLDNAQTFYDNIKDIILSDKDNSNNSASSSSSSIDDNDVDDNDDDDDTYSNEEKINDDNDLQIQNFSPLQAFKDTSTTVAAAISAAMDSLNMKNILLSTASVGEVQGRKRQNDRGTIKYSLITSTSPSTTAPPPILVSSSDISKTQYVTVNDTQQARGRVWNLPKKTYAVKYSSLSAPTSKGSTVISSGRKVKKVKKKLKKLLLPLLLAYKLKFMALIPLLIGGLTLLVGSTGLAGFFFALFTAVMSLKSGSRNAVIVKKYVH